MLKSKSPVSPSLEDYLEAIFFISQKKSPVRVTDVADDLSISKPSVNKAINNLKQQGLVDHEHYGSVSLTEEGLKLAQGVASRHVIIKTFLRDLIGVEETCAEEEACKIEHSMSLETLKKLSDYMKKQGLQPVNTALHN